MTKTEIYPELRHFEDIRDGFVCSVTPEWVADYAADPDFREVLIAPIPEIEVDEPDKDGIREVSVGGVRVAWMYPGRTAAAWREMCDGHLRTAGEAEAFARWIEANPQPDPESVARVQAVRDALAALTDAERAEVLR